ncbi:L-fucose mutarotase [Salinibacterium sp. CAN_S4]|uniref:RbsD/FucU domain-containing protein n=1 Tax=Salinibacterium sp. CAN_S4 TaxID=2787727 RepID=UPI0018EFABDB
MLLSHITHPELLRSLGRCGHGSKVLIADGNYPVVTGAHASADRVFLNLGPDLLTTNQVLAALVLTMPIEAAEIMVPPDHREVEATIGYRALLPAIPFESHPRLEFYDAASDPNVALVIATGDGRAYANILLTFGVR